jgi:hypothetical protein
MVFCIELKKIYGEVKSFAVFSPVDLSYFDSIILFDI